LRTCSRIRDCAPSATASLDFDAALDGTRVHHDAFGLGAAQPFGVDLVVAAVGVQAGQQPLLHALGLQAKRHDDIGVLHGGVGVVGERGVRQRGVGHQRRRRAEPHLRARLRKQRQVRPRDAAVADVAHNRDLAPC
jgi:hypothetical protein